MELIYILSWLTLSDRQLLRDFPPTFSPLVLQILVHSLAGSDLTVFVGMFAFLKELWELLVNA